MAGGLILSADDVALKTATAQGVKAAGGYDGCSATTNASRSHLHRCADPKDRASITIRDAQLIDMNGVRVEGQPFILTAMARQQGYGLHRLPEPHAQGGHWLQHVSALSTEAAEITGKICTCIADDRRLSRDEIEQTALTADAEQLVRLAVHLLAELRASAGE